MLLVASMRKTTSGKLQHHLMAQTFENGGCDEVMARLGARLPKAGQEPGHAVAESGAAAPLRLICDRLIPESQIAVGTKLFEINLNSLTRARRHEAIDKEFPNRLEVADLFDDPSPEELAGFLDAQLAGESTGHV